MRILIDNLYLKKYNEQWVVIYQYENVDAYDLKLISSDDPELIGFVIHKVDMEQILDQSFRPASLGIRAEIHKLLKE